VRRVTWVSTMAREPSGMTAEELGHHFLPFVIKRYTIASTIWPSRQWRPSPVPSKVSERSFKEPTLPEVRLDGVQFEPSALQSCAGSAVRSITIESALRRLHAVACALEVSNGILWRLRPRAFLARTPSCLPWRCFTRSGITASMVFPRRHCNGSKRRRMLPQVASKPFPRFQPSLAQAQGQKNLPTGSRERTAGGRRRP
jgi:hypothetical protein